MSKIKIVYRNVDDLIGAEYNPRQITEKQFNDLCDSIKRFGFKDPMIINKHKDRENIIVAGHQRLRAAKHLGFEQVPTVEVSLTLDQEKEFNVRHNKNTGSFDLDVLANEFEIDNLLEWGFEDWELGVPDFEMEEEETEVKEDDFDGEPPKEPKTVLGDLYELNNHRVHCASSTEIDAVEKLMNGEKAVLVHTDPPYGMNAVSKSGVLSKNYYGDILGDDNISVAIDSFNFSFSFFKCKQVWWGANYYSECLPSSECWLVWDKNNGQSDQTDCELAWANFRSVVRQFTKASEKTNRVHPTQKPVELVAWIFEKFKIDKGIIVDLFLGSGVTLIASEQTGRKCYGQELDPKYCDVIVKRWVKYMKENNKPFTVKRNGKDISKEEWLTE